MRSCSATSTASPSDSCAGGDDGAVAAVDQAVDADLADDRVDRAGTVRRGVEEDAGIVVAAAAAGDEPLPVQRCEAGEHGEAHPQPGVGGPAPDGEGVPRRLHPRHVVGQGRPPARPAGRGSRRGPGMDEQRRVTALQRLEHRTEALEAGLVAERVGRHACARERPVEKSRHRRRVGV